VDKLVDDIIILFMFDIVSVHKIQQLFHKVRAPNAENGHSLLGERYPF